MNLKETLAHAKKITFLCTEWYKRKACVLGIDIMERGWQTCKSSNIVYCTGKMPADVSAQRMMTTCSSPVVQLIYKYVCSVHMYAFMVFLQ